MSFTRPSPAEQPTELEWASSRPTPYAKTGNMLPEALNKVLPFPFNGWAKAMTTYAVKFLLQYYENAAVHILGLPWWSNSTTTRAAVAC